MSIVSHPANDAYRNNFDETFGKKTATAPVKVCGLTYCLDGNAGGHYGVEFRTCGRPADHDGPRGDIPYTKCGRGPT